jgi:hypothetical protein
MALTKNNIESELSYAYLHAVVSQTGMECAITGRHSDGAGIDVRVHALGAFGGSLSDITIEVQLKATTSHPIESDGQISFSLPLKNYNELRSHSQCQRILVVLFLPKDANEWLHQTEEAITIRRCAYWVSLRNAPESDNKTAQTVYLPKKNILGKEALLHIVRTNSQEEWINDAS